MSFISQIGFGELGICAHILFLGGNKDDDRLLGVGNGIRNPEP